MKLKTLLAVFSSVTLIMSFGSARAATVDSAGGGSGYSDNELSMGFFGYTASRDRGNNATRAWGPGLDVNYYMCKYFGVAGETYADAFERPYLLNLLGEARYPLEQMPLSPYAFAGIGRQWRTAPQWLGHIGGGLEYRFYGNIGAFVDARHVFAAKDYNLIRFGIRIAF
jgi:hypothetical protein